MLRRHASYEFIAYFAVITSWLASSPRALEMGGFSLLGLVGAGVVIAAFTAWLLDLSMPRWLFKVVWPFMVFLVYVTLRISADGWSVGAVQNIGIWGGFFFLILLSASASSSCPRFLPRLSQILLIGAWPIAVLLLASIIEGEKDAAIPLAGLVVLAHLVARSSVSRLLSLAPVAILLLLYLFDGARMPVIAGVVLLPTLQLLLTRRGMAFTRVFRTVLLSVGALLLLLVGFIYIDTFRTSFLQGDQAIKVAGLAINTSGRMYWWGVVWDSYLMAPWLGTGEPVPAAMEGIRGWSHPHNDYLRLLHQFGLLGFVLWGLFVWRVLIAIIRNAKACTAAGCERQSYAIHDTAALAMIATLIVMLTDNPVVYSFVMYPLAVVIGAALGARPVEVGSPASREKGRGYADG